MLRTLAAFLCVLGSGVDCFAADIDSYPGALFSEPTFRKPPQVHQLGKAYAITSDAKIIAYTLPNTEEWISYLQPATGNGFSLQMPAKRNITKLLFSPQNDRLAAFTDTGVSLWRIPSDPTKVVSDWTEANVGGGQISLVEWSHDSKRLFLVIQDGKQEVAAISCETGEVEHRIALTKLPDQLVTNQDGTALILRYRDALEVWQAGMQQPKAIPGKVRSLVASPTHNYVAIDSDEAVQLWNLNPLSKAGRLEADRVESVRFSDDGRVLLLLLIDKKAAAYQILPNGQLGLLQTQKASNGPNCLTADGRFAACYSFNGDFQTLVLFRTDKPGEAEVPIFPADHSGYDPDARPKEFQCPKVPKRVMVRWDDNYTEMFDVKTGMSDWSVGTPKLVEARLLDEGNRLITIDADRRLRIHDTDQGRYTYKTTEVAPLIDVARKSKKYISLRGLKFLNDQRHFVVVARIKGGDWFLFIDAESSRLASKVWVADRNGVRGWKVSRDGRRLCVIGTEQATVFDTGLQLVNQEQPPLDKRELIAATLDVKWNDKDHESYVDFTTNAISTSPVGWTYIDAAGRFSRSVLSADNSRCYSFGDLRKDKGVGIEVRSIPDGKQITTMELVTEYPPREMKLGDDSETLWFTTKTSVLRINLAEKSATTVIASYGGEDTEQAVQYDPTATIQPISPSYYHTRDFQSLAVSKSGWIATGHHRGYINIWSQKNGQRYAVFRTRNDKVEQLDISADGKYLISTCRRRKEIQVVNLSRVLPSTPPGALKKKEVPASELDLDF